MAMNVLAALPTVKPCDHATIIEKVKSCPRLPSLRSIETALRELLHADNRFTTQISEVIRRDPSLTARLLRLVNSVYYGLTSPVNSIEEAVFYLGVRQIRQLAVVTPVIEDFQKLAGGTAFQWREFWQHCIATAILTRELTSSIMRLDDESDYVAGLVHDVESTRADFDEAVCAGQRPNRLMGSHKLKAALRLRGDQRTGRQSVRCAELQVAVRADADSRNRLRGPGIQSGAVEHERAATGGRGERPAEGMVSG